ncbi:hypothetical protein HOT95_gp089 [Vibrio phage vB_VpS_PG07]|uniref:Uncharacterized protein n=3 Tax=Pogseptimavirus TaxID=2732037 RepID=A0A411BKH9_9CAUD|nr:hypothetical protein HOT95_gp089 [Vibrio phage vB_VpS_PG07]YP_009819557.1 hypothetical protein HOV08_gp040 [Vibrio phage VspSw_1]AXQ66714.1 hypothetical protein [Vibrio phage vB_VpS_PG07]QAY02113.1 hypothetical protein VspSw1_40 [Vibrio phage VspSw_1]QKN88434.1 hypothetical protein vBValSX1_41 [Vibrio phage vB_ValS_X1]
MRNFVAKHARSFNKAAVHRDRTKYTRNTNWMDEWLDDIEPPRVLI